MPNPPPSRHEPLTAHLYLRLAPTMLADLRHLADRDDRSVSDLVRRWLGRRIAQAYRVRPRQA